ncbi:MAG: hypothetical protein HC877_06440 [Thioploca sp.]|nr:hypothetical protein [Thioploca sp.]
MTNFTINSRNNNFYNYYLKITVQLMLGLVFFLTLLSCHDDIKNILKPVCKWIPIIVSASANMDIQEKCRLPDEGEQVIWVLAWEWLVDKLPDPPPPDGVGTLTTGEEKIIAVLVAPTDITVESFKVELNSNLVDVDSAVSSEHKEIITEELASRQLFNLQSNSLLFYQTTSSILANKGDVARLVMSLNGGERVENGILTIGFITENELNSGSATHLITMEDDVSDNPVGCPPFSVELSSFETTIYNNSIITQWQTGTEIDNAGFRLWRAIENGNGNYINITTLREFGRTEQIEANSDENCLTKIQGQLKVDNSDQTLKFISAVGNSAESTCYSFTDTSNLNDGTYYYLLEDIGDNGNSTFQCDHIGAVIIGQGPVIDLQSAMNYCKEVTGGND